MRLPTWAFGCVLATGCGSPTMPAAPAQATISVAGETFRVALVTTDQVNAARAAQSGGRARIPNGRVVAGTEVNAGWSWHLEDIVFAEVAVEVCDGRPSDVERAGVQFGGGRFCPWSAAVVRIE